MLNQVQHDDGVKNTPKKTPKITPLKGAENGGSAYDKNERFCKYLFS